jgi:hypothetical protein
MWRTENVQSASTNIGGDGRYFDALNDARDFGFGRNGVPGRLCKCACGNRRVAPSPGGFIESGCGNGSIPGECTDYPFNSTSRDWDAVRAACRSPREIYLGRPNRRTLDVPDLTGRRVSRFRDASGRALACSVAFVPSAPAPWIDRVEAWDLCGETRGRSIFRGVKHDDRLDFGGAP